MSRLSQRERSGTVASFLPGRRIRTATHPTMRSLNFDRCLLVASGDWALSKAILFMVISRPMRRAFFQ